MLEMIDNKISLVLEKVCKHIEGLQCNVPYSKEKENVRAILLYWTAKKKI